MQPIVTLCLTDDGFVIHRVEYYCESLEELKAYYEPE